MFSNDNTDGYSDEQLADLNSVVERVRVAITQNDEEDVGDYDEAYERADELTLLRYDNEMRDNDGVPPQDARERVYRAVMSEMGFMSHGRLVQ